MKRIRTLALISAQVRLSFILLTLALAGCQTAPSRSYPKYMTLGVSRGISDGSGGILMEDWDDRFVTDSRGRLETVKFELTWELWGGIE